MGECAPRITSLVPRSPGRLHVAFVLSLLCLSGLVGCSLSQPTIRTTGSTVTAPPITSFPYRKTGSGYPSLAPLMRQVTPAVVNISVDAEVSLEDHPFLRDPEFRRFLDRLGLPAPRSGAREHQQSVGSGVIVDAARGLVMTNAHLLNHATEIQVTLKDRRSFNARRIVTDSATDIAILRIPPVNVRPLRLADSDRLEVGDFVIAIGNPFGLGQTVTSGIVSAVGRSGVGDDRLGELIQTDASINPGNSGGPLIDLSGAIVGINAALIGPGGGNVGIGFAVPSNRARNALNRALQRQ